MFSKPGASGSSLRHMRTLYEPISCSSTTENPSGIGSGEGVDIDGSGVAVAAGSVGVLVSVGAGVAGTVGEAPGVLSSIGGGCVTAVFGVASDGDVGLVALHASRISAATARTIRSDFNCPLLIDCHLIWTAHVVRSSYCESLIASTIHLPRRICNQIRLGVIATSSDACYNPVKRTWFEENDLQTDRGGPKMVGGDDGDS